MNLIDVNVLLALFRADHAHHARARSWWEGAEASGEAFTVPDIVVVGFCRLVTHPRVYRVPATFAEAEAFISAVLSHDLCLGFAADLRMRDEFLRLGRDQDLRGSILTDAYLAACATSLGATVVTFDRDFRRFDGLRTLEPA